MINALAYGVKSKQWADFKTGLDENMGFDAQYDTKEEKENTEQNEHPYIREINEIERNLHVKCLMSIYKVQSLHGYRI